MDTTNTTPATRTAEDEKKLADLYADAHRALTAAFMAALNAEQHDESHALSHCATMVHRQAWQPAIARYEALRPKPATAPAPAPAPTPAKPAKRATPKPVATRLECLECGRKFTSASATAGTSTSNARIAVDTISTSSS